MRSGASKSGVGITWDKFVTGLLRSFVGLSEAQITATWENIGA